MIWNQQESDRLKAAVEGLKALADHLVSRANAEDARAGTRAQGAWTRTAHIGHLFTSIEFAWDCARHRLTAMSAIQEHDNARQIDDHVEAMLKDVANLIQIVRKMETT